MQSDSKDNRELQDVVKKFQKGMISRKNFLKEVNTLILNIPVYMGCNDKDIRHDFYAHVIAKIDKIIASYKEIDTASFKTWFDIVLKRVFCNFIKKLNKKKNSENKQVYELFHNDILQSEYNSIKDEKPSSNFSILTEKEKNIIALKFGILMENRDVRDSTNKIIERLEKKIKIEQLITKRYFKLINIQKNISREIDDELIITLRNQETKIKYSKRQLEKALNSFSVLPSNQWVGNKLGITSGTVGAHLTKIKKKMLRCKTYR